MPRRLVVAVAVLVLALSGCDSSDINYGAGGSNGPTTPSAPTPSEKPADAMPGFPDGVPDWSKKLPGTFAVTLSSYFRKKDCEGLQANFDAMLTIAETQADTKMATAALEGGDYADMLLRKAGCYN